MGFCRRCGDIVVGARCTCGGTAVAPVVPWTRKDSADSTNDKWSNTYVQRARSVSPTRPPTRATVATTQTSPTKRFPRPISYTSSSSDLGTHVSAHIASLTSSTSRPPSPLKHSTQLTAPEADILPSPHDATLSKVYGSVLQPKETLTTHSCAICSSPFLPDATIYPDPAALNSSHSRFLCRPCYEANGGTKGLCPTCSRPVLTLKSEGGFIHAANQYWHKRCFNCSGCFKYVGDAPMVDLLGLPSCVDCFEGCLKRDSTTPKKNISVSHSNRNSPRVEISNNIGGMSSASRTRGRQSREGSPAIGELEQRLGIAGGRLIVEDLGERLPKPAPQLNEKSMAETLFGTHRDGLLNQSNRSPGISTSPTNVTPPQQRGSPGLRASPSHKKTTPLRHQPTGSPVAKVEAIEEMKQRFMKSPSSSPSRGTSPISPFVRGTPPLRLSRSSNSLHFSPKIKAPTFNPGPTSPAVPQAPDLIADFSDATQSSGPDSPPRNDDRDVFNASPAYGTDYGLRHTRKDCFDSLDDVIPEETTSQIGTPSHTPNTIRSLTSSPSLKTSQSTSFFESPSKSKSAKPPHYTEDLPSLSHLSSNSATDTCEGCGRKLFSVQGGGKFVTVPGDRADSSPITYHVECFRCAVCDRIFSGASTGHAVFVKANGGACHVECAPPARMTIHKMPSTPYVVLKSTPVATSSSPSSPKIKAVTHPTPPSSSRLERPSLTAPSSMMSFPRFGSRSTCPGCTKAVSLMENGVVPGPSNTRWHASCLVCGGKKETSKRMVTSRSREKTVPGCGKRLDSAAKTGADGGIWCRECLLFLGISGSPHASPTRAPLSPTFTGSSRITPQVTGTTIARQFTGIGGGGDPGLLRQLTGGGLSPTRSISPTKHLGGGTRPRPKSVMGMRNAKSVDEGRGMFLVRQLTGME